MLWRVRCAQSPSAGSFLGQKGAPHHVQDRARREGRRLSGLAQGRQTRIACDQEANIARTSSPAVFLRAYVPGRPSFGTFGPSRFRGLDFSARWRAALSKTGSRGTPAGARGGARAWGSARSRAFGRRTRPRRTGLADPDSKFFTKDEKMPYNPAIQKYEQSLRSENLRGEKLKITDRIRSSWRFPSRAGSRL